MDVSCDLAELSQEYLKALRVFAAVAVATLPLPALATEIYYIHADHLDTPRLIENQSQQVVWRWDNDDPFGGNVANVNPSGLGAFEFNLRFPGQYFDKETNQHYNYFRDYSPEIGRYIESDPIGLEGGLNTYTYVGMNPMSRFDKEGKKWSTSVATIWIGGCSLYALNVASEQYPHPGDDKKKHCYASCILNKCTLWSFLPSLAVGWGLEQAQRVSGSGVYDPKDIDANIHGIVSSYIGDCKKSCDACPIQ